jgi:hypothetical protein
MEVEIVRNRKIKFFKVREGFTKAGLQRYDAIEYQDWTRHPLGGLGVIDVPVKLTISMKRKKIPLGPPRQYKRVCHA